MVNFCLQSYALSLIYPIFICVNPDPYSESGSTKFLNTDSIWTRIHNTARNLMDIPTSGTDDDFCFLYCNVTFISPYIYLFIYLYIFVQALLAQASQYRWSAR